MEDRDSPVSLCRSATDIVIVIVIISNGVAVICMRATRSQAIALQRQARILCSCLRYPLRMYSLSVCHGTVRSDS